MIWLEITSVFAPIATLIGGACFRLLRSIDQRLTAIDDRTKRSDFTQDLHILDHEQRLAELGSPRWSHR